MTIQVPPAVGSSGQFVETVNVTGSSEHRQVSVIGSPTSSALVPATSSGGLLVAISNPSTAVTISNPSTAVTVTNPSTAVNTLSSGPVLVLTSGPLTLTTAFVSTSVTVTNLIRSLSSGTVTLSSNPTVVLSSATSLSSGIVTMSSVQTVTATAATNPWSSAPSFNLPMVSASSGLVQISGTPTVTATAATNPWSSAPSFNVPVVNASSGAVQAIVTGSSGVSAIVTSSGALLVSGTPGSVSTAVNLLTSGGVFYPATSSYGLIIAPIGTYTSARLIVGTTVGKISSGPGILHTLVAYSTSTPAANAAYIRLYDQTTGNATSANNAGLAGACFLGRIQSTVVGSAVIGNMIVSPIRFGTACSFDIVVNATSTAAQLAGWVTAQYTSS